MIIRRDVLTIGNFCVVVELNLWKHRHKRGKAADRDRLPAYIACAVQPERGNESLAGGFLYGATDIIGERNHECVTVFEEPTSLADSGFLNVVPLASDNVSFRQAGLASDQAAPASGIKASRAATFRRHGANLEAG
jgi:hypothetical protein